jgi:hypothetical protein
VLGLVGGSIAFATATAELFSVYSQTSTAAGVAIIPEAAFEALLGIWLVVKGFNPSPIISSDIEYARAPGVAAAPRPTSA